FILGHQDFGIYNVVLGRFIAQGIQEGIAEYIYISIFTEYHWDNQPMVGGSHTAVCTVVPIKSAVLPFRNVRCHPVRLLFPNIVIGGGMYHIVYSDTFSLGNGPGSFADQGSVHDNRVAHFEIMEGEFMLGGKIVLKGKRFPFKVDYKIFFHILQSGKDIIIWMYLQKVFGHSGIRLILKFYSGFYYTGSGF